MPRHDKSIVRHSPSLSALWRSSDSGGRLAVAGKVAVSLLLLWIALRSVDWSMISTRLGRADPLLCQAALVALGVQLLVFACRWRLVTLMSGINLTLRQSVRYTHRPKIARHSPWFRG